MTRVAINGLGRIGRSAFKIAFDKFKEQIEIVAVNDLADNKTLADLLKHDSNYGIWAHEVGSDEENITVDGKNIRSLSEKDPTNLPWKELNIDVVLECTGVFTSKSDASKHIMSGAKRVIISAPSHDDDPAPTFVLGLNKYDGKAEVINNASCTTNSVAPMIKILEENFGVEKALMTTVHAYTQDQLLQDGPHKDLRRARNATENIVPTTTGAAIATTEVITDLEWRFDGISLRVPVAVGSISDITAVLKKDVTIEEVNSAFEKASKSEIWQGILEVSTEPIVSTDIVGSSASVIIDLPLTKVIGNLVKVFGWYDNEFGYANRLVEQAVEVGESL